MRGGISTAVHAGKSPSCFTSIEEKEQTPAEDERNERPGRPAVAGGPARLRGEESVQVWETGGNSGKERG